MNRRAVCPELRHFLNAAHGGEFKPFPVFLFPGPGIIIRGMHIPDVHAGLSDGFLHRLQPLFPVLFQQKPAAQSKIKLLKPCLLREIDTLLKRQRRSVRQHGADTR